MDEKQKYQHERCLPAQWIHWPAFQAMVIELESSTCCTGKKNSWKIFTFFKWNKSKLSRYVRLYHFHYLLSIETKTHSNLLKHIKRTGKQAVNFSMRQWKWKMTDRAHARTHNSFPKCAAIIQNNKKKCNRSERRAYDAHLRNSIAAFFFVTQRQKSSRVCSTLLNTLKINCVLMQCALAHTFAIPNRICL